MTAPKFLAACLLTVTVFAAAAPRALAAVYDDESPQKSMLWLVDSEFLGDEDARGTWTDFSPATKAKTTKWQRYEATLKLWDEDPLVVVSSYDILKIEVNRASAVAVVRYEQLARAEGRELSRRFIRDRKVEDVRYQLALENGRWMILDPPEPRVSLKALLRNYELHLSLTDQSNMNDPRMARTKKPWFRKIQEDYAFLKGLAN